MVVDLETDRLSWRRLDLLLRHLPRDSHFVRAISGEIARWGESEHLLASILDALQLGNWQRFKRWFKSAPEYEPISRPGVEAKPKRMTVKPSALARMMGR